MLPAIWIAFLLVMLFLLGCTVGSFLNVCIVRLPQGRSLMRPGSCCGNCHKPIRMRDNLPLLSYWLLRGRCRMCGARFSRRYFWIELLTGLVFVLIFHLEIGWNVHHFAIWYDSGYWFLHAGVFPPQSWLLFPIHALLACFLIVATMCNLERHSVPGSVTRLGILTGLMAAMVCAWPWPSPPEEGVTQHAGGIRMSWQARKPYEWGPRVGSMPSDEPWWMGSVTPRGGLVPWPVCGPLPSWLPPGSWPLGLTTGLAGVLAGAILMGLVRLLFNAGAGVEAIGWGETSLMMIAGAFLGWQSIVVAALLGLIPGLIAATMQWAMWRRKVVSFSVWLALAIVAVWFGWYWIGPLVQGLFFNETRLLLLAAVFVGVLLAFAGVLRLTALARRQVRT